MKKTPKLIYTPEQRLRLNKISQSHLLLNMNERKLKEFFFICGVEDTDSLLKNLVKIENMVKAETQKFL